MQTLFVFLIQIIAFSAHAQNFPSKPIATFLVDPANQTIVQIYIYTRPGIAPQPQAWMGKDGSYNDSYEYTKIADSKGIRTFAFQGNSGSYVINTNLSNPDDSTITYTPFGEPKGTTTKIKVIQMDPLYKCSGMMERK